MSNVVRQDFAITKSRRRAANKHNSFVVWFTGLSGSGKSTLANALEYKLFDLGVHTFVLDGDNTRMGLNKDLGFSLEERKENIRRVSELSKLFVDAGLLTITSFISPLESDRLMAKETIGEQDFIQVFVDCPLEECESRDVKGLYKKARAGEIKEFTGINSPFENPSNPDITVNTLEKNIDECLQAIWASIVGKLYDSINE